MRIVAITALALAGCASVRAAPGAADAASARAAVSNWAHALEERVIEPIVALYEPSDEVTVIESTGDVHVGIAAVREMYVLALDEVRFESVRVTEPRIRASGGVAWVAGDFEAATARRSDGSRWRLRTHASWVLVRRGGRYVIVLEHFSTLRGVPRIDPL